MPSINVCAVVRVAREPRGLTALVLVLIDRDAQRGDHVRRRRVAPLRRLLHVDVLVVQIHRQRMRSCRRGSRARFPARSRSPCRARLRGICRSPRPAHRTESARTSIGSAANELIASTISPLPCLRHACATPARSFSMPAPVSQCTCATCVIDGIGSERRLDDRGGGRLILRHREIDDRAIQILADSHDARAVRAVVRHQHLAVARHQRADRSLDRKCAAALQRHAACSRRRR